jgi:ribosomal protein S18 acetylase RimI-like enzyme
MLFPDSPLVRRIERAEARSLAAILATGGGPGAFSLPIGSGFALYNEVDSPFNKLVGLGFEPVEASGLAALEQRYHALEAPVQAEISTHADPALTNLLAGRGYRLTGFENVLGRALGAECVQEDALRPPDIEVRLARPAERTAWMEVLITGALQPAGDEQPAAHDSFDRATLERAYRSMMRCADLECWLAFRGTTVAGGAALSMRDGVAHLVGAATHPAHRRRGVQRALLTARLAAGQQRGCDIAVVTTQPGSQSQHNVHRCGFSLLYARAIWQLRP